MGERHRWVDLFFTILTVGVLSLFGKYYHRWGWGVVAAASVVALREGVYRVSGRWEKWRRAKRRASEHAVLVHLDGTGLPAAVYKEYALDAIETELASIIDAQRLGENGGNALHVRARWRSALRQHRSGSSGLPFVQECARADPPRAAWYTSERASV